MKTEQTIHINVELRKEGLHNVSITKTRIWPQLLTYLRWSVFGKQIPSFVSGGLGLNILNNLAIIVEGVVTDLVEEHAKRTGLISLDCDRDGWDKKKKAYNRIFQNKLETYPCYDAVEVLFWFRNNIAHGRSHSEVLKIESETGEKSPIESESKKYEKIRRYLIDKKMMKNSDTPNNVDFLWKLENAIVLYSQVIIFLESVLAGNESSYKDGIISEWKTAIAY
jgi:hypothetical protein